MKVVLWNSGGWKNKQGEMIVRLREKEIDVFIVTEIKTRKEDIVKVNGNMIFYITVENGIKEEEGGGVLIRIKKGISWERLKGKEKVLGYRDMETIGNTVKGLKKNCNILGVYRRPGKRVPKYVWQESVKEVNEKRTSNYSRGLQCA